MNRTHPICAALPFFCGLAGAAGLLLFFGMADSGTGIAVLSCLLFLCGCVSAVPTCRERRRHPYLWWGGTLVCVVGVLGWAGVYGLVLALGHALRNFG